MNGLDFAIVIALSVGALYGLSHGAIRTFTSAVALFGGLSLSHLYHPMFGSCLIRKKIPTSM